MYIISENMISTFRSTSTDYISISHCHSPYDVFMGRQLGLEEGGREGKIKGGKEGEIKQALIPVTSCHLNIAK